MPKGNRPIHHGRTTSRESDGHDRDQWMLAHVAAYLEFVGPIPPGMYVLQACHLSDPDCPGGPECKHRSCVRPDHLQLVTWEEHIELLGEEPPEPTGRG